MIDECRDIVRRAEREGRIEFRLSELAAKLYGESAAEAVDIIYRMAMAMGLVFFEYSDGLRRESVYIVETRKSYEEWTARLNARIADMKARRPVLSAPTAPPPPSAQLPGSSASP